MSSLTVNAIFGRGGIRGIAMVGAVHALENAAYRFDRVGGISVGGIVAALLAAGYDAAGITRVVWDLDFAGLRDVHGLGRVPVLGPAWNLVTRLGIYDGDALVQVVREAMEARGVRTFRDLRDPEWNGLGSPYRLQVVAADVTRGRMVLLPDDAPAYGLDPDALDVALALRMTASVPLFYRPLRLGPAADRSVIVDGGLLAGLPFHIFDCGRRGDRPLLGVQAGPARRRPLARTVRGPISLIAASYYTALTANAACQRAPADTGRRIDIDCGETSAVAFGLSDLQKQELFDAGVRAAAAFIGSDRAQPVERSA